MTPAADRPIDEDDTPRPVESYGRSKLEAERIVETFSDHVATTIVRPSAVFGPRDRDFLTLFRFAYPSERALVPRWVMRGLMGRLAHELESGVPERPVVPGPD